MRFYFVSHNYCTENKGITEWKANRANTYKYSLNVNGKPVQGCKTFVLHTLHVSKQWVNTALDRTHLSGSVELYMHDSYEDKAKENTALIK